MLDGNELAHVFRQLNGGPLKNPAIFLSFAESRDNGDWSQYKENNQEYNLKCVRLKRNELRHAQQK